MSSDGHWEQVLPRFSLARRVTVVVLLLTTVVLGAVAAGRIPLELIPRGYEEPRLMIDAPWRDAPPREVLDKVVLPLEEELSTVGGIDQINSWSSTASGRIFLSFKHGTDMDVAYREVRDRILRARPRLPEDLEQVLILKHDESTLPVVVLGVAIDPQVADPYELVRREIVVPIQRVDGVASVKFEGLQQKEILIELDRERTQAAGLNIYAIAQELSADNFSIASGNVHHGRQKLLLRSVSRYGDLEELRSQLVARDVRLSDIGTVDYAVADQLWRVRVNDKPALAVQVLKEGQANVIDVGKRLEKVFEEIRDNPRLAGSDVAMIFNQADVIEESLATLIGSGQIGAILAVAVLLFFLRRLRLTLIITLAIPLSIVAALAAMHFAGETLNILSLLGLIISVGLLVDNSVVVAENIHRLFSEGASAADACIKGTAEITLAVILATLTTIIVFLPVSLVEGQSQFFLLRLAIPITVSLLGSLAVALVVVPLFVYLTLARERSPTDRPIWRRAAERLHSVMDRALGGVYRITLGTVSRGYVRLLKIFLVHRADLVLLLIAALISALGAFSQVQVVPVSQEDQRSFEIEVELPSGYSLEDAEEFFRSVEPVLAELREELGLDGTLIVHTAWWGEVSGWMSPASELNARQVIERVMERLPRRPGVNYSSGIEDRGKREVEERHVYSAVLTGEDPDRLADVARHVQERMTQVEGVVGVRRARDMTPNELALVVDRGRAQRQGVSPQVVAGVVALALRGQPLPRYHTRDGREIPTRIRFEKDDRESLAELAEFAAPASSGALVPLSSLTDVDYVNAARGIWRSGKRISQRIMLDLAEADPDAARKRLEATAESFDLPDGIQLGTTDGISQLDEDVAAMKFAALVSILFIYLLMGFLFESFILPLSIICTIPLAAIGVIWTHALTGRDLDMLGLVGVILLIGVVVNNGIVLVDYINRLRTEGHARGEAIVLAARRRFRPIMMTAGTTIGGMIPLTLGEPTSIGLSYRSFGLTLIGGMITATVLTLLVVPVFYTLFQDAGDALRRLVHRAAR